MNFHDRLRKIEEAIDTKSDEERFHELVDGEYDATKTLEENLADVEFPPGALPSIAPPDDNEQPENPAEGTE